MESKDLAKSYDRIANWWTEQMRGSVYGMDYMQKALGLAKAGGKVLDIGCGSTGRLLHEALEFGFEVTSLDLSLEMIRIAQKKHPQAQFIRADFLAWNAPHKYDLIIAWDSVFHAPHEQQAPITRKMCGLLKSGGILLFTAGSYAGEASGEMNGERFEYATLGYMAYLQIIQDMNCKIILMEEDQFPAGHMVFICQRTGIAR